MALRFYTGFDYYDETQTSRVWPFSAGGHSLNPGRFAGRGWQFNNESAFLSTLIPNASTTVVGFALSAFFGDATNPILVLQDATTSHTSPLNQLDVRLTNDGAFQVTRNGTVLGATPSFTFTFSNNTLTAWNYVEVKSFINNSTGYVIIRVGGQVFLNIASLDTQNTGNNYINMVRFQPFASTGNYFMKLDDVYIIDDSGPSPQNDFLGECRVQTQFPTANGETNNFTAIGAANNYQAVDETISDDDTTYVRSGVVGNIDDYNMGTVSMTGTIYGVQLNVTHRKDDVGSRTVTPVIHSAGTFYEGGLFTCQSNYTIAQNIWSLEPHGLLPWTNSTVNAITAGVKIKA
jgi:hypothetical protein